MFNTTAMTTAITITTITTNTIHQWVHCPEKKKEGQCEINVFLYCCLVGQRLEREMGSLVPYHYQTYRF